MSYPNAILESPDFKGHKVEGAQLAKEAQC